MAVRIAAGVARADITPPRGIAHAGWGAQTHQRAAGVDMPLYATALALSDGDRAAVLVDLDLIYLWEREATAARDAVSRLTGLPLESVRVSYTHTHSGPVTGGTWSSWFTEGAEEVAAYDAALPHYVAGVAREALRALRPARACVGSGSCRIAVNRRFQRPEDGAVVVGRNRAGSVDREVKVVRIDSEDGSPLAAVVNYACHPIIVGPDNDLITPDYPGVVRRVVEGATGAACLFLQGAAGNVGPARGVARGGIEEYRRLGAILGHEASCVWWELGALDRPERYVCTLESGAPLAVYEDEPAPLADGRLAVGTRAVGLPMREMPDPEQMSSELEACLRRLEELRTSDAGGDEVRYQTMLAKRWAMRAEAAREARGRLRRDIELQGFALGPEIALLAVPGEPFVEIGLEVKRRSPFEHTLFSGYSNVGTDYIPWPDAYPLGGYEVEITPFAPGAAGLLVEGCLELLAELEREARVPR